MTAPTIEILANPPNVNAMPNAVTTVAGAFVRTIQVTTVTANLLLIVVSADNAGSQIPSVASVMGAGLTFTKVTSVLNEAYSDYLDLEVWAAPVSSPIANATITVTLAVTGGSNIDAAGLMALGVQNAGSFDTASGLPGTAVASTYTAPPPQVTYSTSNAADLLFYFGLADSATNSGVPTGWTASISGTASNTRFLTTNAGTLAPGIILSGNTTVSPIPTGILSSMVLFGIEPTLCDPYFNDVQLLLHFDGTAGSNTFPDSSQNNLTMSPTAATVVETTTVYAGTGSGAFTGGNGIGATFMQSPSIATAPELNIDTGDFTWEMWAYPTTTSNDIGGFGIYGVSAGFSLNVGGGPVVTASVYGGSTMSVGATVNAWNHVALVRHGSNFTLYVNGVGNTSPTPYSGTLNLAAHTSSSVLIGVAPSSTGFVFDGYLDEFRLTVGVARYTANFTPASGPFPNVMCGASGAAAITESHDTVAGVGSVPATLTVPNVINLSEAIAESTIIGAGFTVGTISFAADVLIIAGNVDAQSPAGGTTALAGTNVNITVSTGRGSVVVPELVGLASPVAYTALESVGLGIGAVGDAYSATVPAGVVISQDVAAGTTVASGTLVGFVVSLGALPSTTLFNIEPTVISQYANSPTLLQWLANMNQYLDQSQNFANFLEYVWNVDTAVGFGLDIWGKIVNVGRLVRIPNTTKFVGFYIAGESQPSQDWTPAGDNRQNPPVGGAFYSGYNATQAYLLSDGAYRQLILAKAFANICTTTAPAINQILQNLYGAGAAWVSVTGLMAIAYNFNFTPTPVQLAILTQSGVVPTPPGVVATVVHP